MEDCYLLSVQVGMKYMHRHLLTDLIDLAVSFHAIRLKILIFSFAFYEIL